MNGEEISYEDPYQVDGKYDEFVYDESMQKEEWNNDGTATGEF